MGENSNSGSRSNFCRLQGHSAYHGLNCGMRLRSRLGRGKCVSLSVGNGGGQQCYWDRAFRTYGVKHTVPYTFFRSLGLECITCSRCAQVFLVKENSKCCTHNNYAPVSYHCITNRHETWYTETRGVYVSFKSEIWAGGVLLTHLCFVVSGATS